MMKKARILIVDDTPVNLKLLSSVLARKEYEVRAARNGAMALQAVDTSPPDLILLDIAMPDMDGYLVCSHLKADPRTADIPIIFISALNDTEDIIKAFEVGGVDYITKPFKIKEVLARVENQLTMLFQRREIATIHERDRQHFARLTEMRNQFIGTATHDLKNPLSLITGHVYLLSRLPALAADPVAQGYLQMVTRGAMKIKLLITDMLDLIQIESQGALQVQPVSLDEFLRDCLSDFVLQAEKKGITLRLEDMPAITVALHPEAMGRSVDNLLSNAIKYTAAGGTVSVRAGQHQDLVWMEVEDTGLGIPAHELPELFTTFHRVQTPQHLMEEGTGLGLSIVKAIVEQHGGRVEVDSIEGQGSCFRILIPALAEAPVETDSIM
ncbi:MAG: hybrid sensor histidine kinase/response regulator [Anaerolineae bacterium]|nr:hybrid sensor histidine kinase/response regulator [Anaerolineae bacterium]